MKKKYQITGPFLKILEKDTHGREQTIINLRTVEFIKLLKLRFSRFSTDQTFFFH